MNEVVIVLRSLLWKPIRDLAIVAKIVLVLECWTSMRFFHQSPLTWLLIRAEYGSIPLNRKCASFFAGASLVVFPPIGRSFQ